MSHKNQIFTFLFLIPFLLINQSEASGQSRIKLSSSFGNGGQEEIVCIDSNRYGISFFNNSSDTIEIIDITISTIPYNSPYNVPFEAFALNPFHTYVYIEEFNDYWSDLLDNYQTVHANMEIIYGINVNGIYEIKTETLDSHRTYCIDVAINGSSDNDSKEVDGSKGLVKNRTQFAFTQVSPNPTGSEFSLSYRLETNEIINIGIFNSVGKEIKTLVNNQIQEKGEYLIQESVPSGYDAGIYYIISRVGGKTSIEKLIKI